MAYLIGNARIDERGKASGGAAGDQTGTEVRIQNWYSYPWNCVIRPKSAAVAEKMASTMEILCKGNLVGYDQYQRTTLYTEMNKVGWDASKLATKCETDCSAMVAVCANAAGISVSKDIWTGNMIAAFRATGQFDVLYDSKYLTSGAYLKRGDILLNTVHHTAIALTTGANAGTGSTASASTTSSGWAIGKTWTNGTTPEMVYQDTICKGAIGSLEKRETCLCFGTKNGRYGVYYQIDGTSQWKAGFVKYSGAVSGSFASLKTWKNGSTEEPVYMDTSCTKRVGSLNQREQAQCFAKRDGCYGILYQIDGTSDWKAGWVQYAGGLS